MDKRILKFGIIIAVLLLVTISIASAVNTTISDKKKESPLYGIRTRMVISERLGELLDNIKTKYIGERVFLLPFQWIRKQGGISVRQQLGEKSTFCQVTTCSMTLGK